MPIHRDKQSEVFASRALEPWSKCEGNKERLSPLNGIPLTPVANELVYQGLVTFGTDGRAIFSLLLKPDETGAMGIDVTKEYRIKILEEGQEEYLDYHRTNILKSEV